MRLSFFVVLLAGCAAAVGSASAQQTVGPKERYCLEAFDTSGIHPLMCRYETYEQCVQSKTWPGDKCFLNPYLAFQQRR
jgi:hypothetical protein